MKGFPKLTNKEILKRHKKNPQDQSVYTIIETKELKKDTFNKLVQGGIKLKPFDKK